MDSISEAYREKKKWEQAMGVGTLDKMFDVLSGKKIDYSEQDYLATEPEEHHIDFSSLTKTASIEIPSGMTNFQRKAIEKYPSLIEMLGKEESHDLANKLAEVLNNWIIEKIAQNSNSINKNSVSTKQEEGFIKQYFKYSDRVGFVKVSGKFSGEEYIHYDEKQRKAMVLLKLDEKKYKNISENFNIEMHFVDI